MLFRSQLAERPAPRPPKPAHAVAASNNDAGDVQIDTLIERIDSAMNSDGNLL